MINILIPNGVDVASAALQKKGDCSISKTLLDHLASKSRYVRAVPSFWDTLDRMASEIEDHGKRVPALLLELENTDFGINRSNTYNLFIRRKGIGMTHICLSPVSQAKTPILHDPVLMTFGNPHGDRRQIVSRLLHCLHGALRNVTSDETVTMAGIDKKVAPAETKLFQSTFHRGKKVLAQGTDFLHGYHIQRDNCDLGSPVTYYQRSGKQRTVYRAGVVISDVYPGYSSPQFLARL